MATYYVGQGGSNPNDGLSFANRKATMANVALSLVSGDTVVMCANASGEGNRYTWTEQIPLVSNIRYTVYPGHWVRLDVATTGTTGAINGSGVTGVVIEPDQGFLELGDPADWTPNGGDGNWYGYSARRQLNLVNCSNMQFIGNRTDIESETPSNFIIHGGAAYEANTVDSSCNLILFRGIDVNRHGTNNTKSYVSNPNADDGDMFAVYGTRIYFYRCVFSLGGHQNLAHKGRWVVIDDCLFNGDWTGVTDNADAGRGAPIERSGSRSFAVVAADAVHGASSPYGPTLVENCIMRNAGSAGDEPNNANAKVDGYRVIFRRNHLWDGCDAALVTATHDDFDHNSLGYINVYHNTCYGNGRIMDIWTVDVFNNLFRYCNLLNNIFDQQAGAYYQGIDIEQFRRRAVGEASDGFSNEWKGGRYDGNIARMSASAPEGTTVTVELVSFGGTTTDYTWTTVDNTYPNNWGIGNVAGTSPTYVGSPGTGQRTRAAFMPNGGIETGNAEPLAYTNGSGTTTQTINLDPGQAHMFHDDWGMGSLGITGDYVQIGSNDPVLITSIPNDSTLVVASFISYSDNDPVYLCVTPDGGSNFTVFSDIGAGQTSTITPDPYEPVYEKVAMVIA